MTGGETFKKIKQNLDDWMLVMIKCLALFYEKKYSIRSYRNRTFSTKEIENSWGTLCFSRYQWDKMKKCKFPVVIS